jgi:hypothetical protein
MRISSTNHILKLQLSIGLLFTFLASGYLCQGQVQLLLMKRGEVVLRLNPGDEIVYALKGSKDIYRTYVNNLSDTSVTTGNVEVPFRKIERLYFSQKQFYNDLGEKMTAAGVLLFAADQINNSIVQGNDFSLNRGVTVTSIILAGAGLPMALIRKKSQVINYKYQLITVRKDSPLYR